MAATATKRRETPADKAERRAASGKCLTCDKPSATRGLCQACYMAAHRAIKAGDISEEAAIANGKILPQKRGAWAKQAGLVGRKARSA